jgi:hypothetical protein
MSIKTTLDKKRKDCIERIIMIQNLILSQNYFEIDNLTNEDEYDIEDFIDNYENLININTLNNYTNKMLERIIDEPFFRNSKFENYNVID